MNRKSAYRILIIFAIVMANIGCDQMSKKMIRENVADNETIAVNDHLTVTRVENTGAFLSFGDSLPGPVKNILLSVLPLIALSAGFIIIIVKKTIPGMALLGFCFVIGGGTGNIFDRIAYGSVTDFLHLDLGIFETGIFNMADVSIMTGTFIILLQIFSAKGRSPLA
ncbi:MAG: signal peptidase II [Chitinophagaceae bacterium]|nr:signal peptidase II [Chitinophagaceae bacterium]